MNDELEDKLEYIMSRIFDSGIVGDGNYVYFDDLKRVLGEILCIDNKEEAKPDPCEGKMCYKFDGPSCENCSEVVCAFNMYYERYEFKCNKKGKIIKIPKSNIVGGMEILPGSFNEEEK